MKIAKLVGLALGLGVIGVGAIMAVTNPDESAFEDFALEKVKTEGCKEVPEIVRSQCPKFIQDNQTQLKAALMRNTERENYGLFSIYRTNLSVRSLVPDLPAFLDLPAFELETIALFGKFYIYEAQQQPSDNRTSK